MEPCLSGHQRATKICRINGVTEIEGSLWKYSGRLKNKVAVRHRLAVPANKSFLMQKKNRKQKTVKLFFRSETQLDGYADEVLVHGRFSWAIASQRNQ